MAASFGPKTALFWPYAGWAMLGLLLITGGLLIMTGWRRPQERFRVVGLLAFLGAMTSLSLALGWGRSSFGPFAGFQSRYVTLAVPLLCCVYFVWELYGGWALRHFGQMTLFALMCALLTPSTIWSLDDAEPRRRIAKAMERDLREGVPISVFVNRYNGWNFIFPPPHPPLYNDLPISNERHDNTSWPCVVRTSENSDTSPLDDPPFEMSVPVVPIEHNQMTWDEGVGRGTGVDPYMVFALNKPAYLYGIKLKYTVHNGKKPAPIRVSWKRSGRNEFSLAERNVLVNVETGKENTTIIPVHDAIDRYRIDLGDPTSAIKISEIELVLPPPVLAGRR